MERRVYEPRASDDGKRILVDRLWLHELTKENAAVDLWLKDIAPATDFLKWFGHDPSPLERISKAIPGRIEKECWF